MSELYELRGVLDTEIRRLEAYCATAGKAWRDELHEWYSREYLEALHSEFEAFSRALAALDEAADASRAASSDT